MRYSRFDETSGLYDVFEDGRGGALNADLPLPRLGSVQNGIGVPARSSGRPLPSGAKLVGSSWQPQGLIVASKALGAVGQADSGGGSCMLRLLGYMSLMAGACYLAGRYSGAKRRGGAVTMAVGGAAVAYITAVAAHYDFTGKVEACPCT